MEDSHDHEPIAMRRRSEVAGALATVRDPEIDEAINELKFITGVEIDGETVTVHFRLPTFWCPANFAFMMAEDMRQAVLSLKWVKHFNIRLDDHFAAGEISEGISNNRPFDVVFPSEAGKNIAATRQTFAKKSFLTRQRNLLKALRSKQSSEIDLSALTLGDLKRINNKNEMSQLIDSYLEMRARLGLSVAPCEPLVVSEDGSPIASENLEDHLRYIRGVDASARSAGAMCKILLAARFDGKHCTKPYHKSKTDALSSALN